MEMRDYGLLGFHFLIALNEKNTVKNLFADFTISYITKSHSEEISLDVYNELLATNNFGEVVTAYIGTEDDCSFSITYSSGYLEVWFGFYPGTNITGYKTLLGKLNNLADYCVAGFEVEIGSAIAEDGAEELSPNFHPFCLLRSGKLKWCGQGVNNEMETLIHENLKGAGLID
jgi:hypothetical protein